MTWDDLHRLTSDELREMRAKALKEIERQTLSAKQCRAELGTREAEMWQREAAKAKQEWAERTGKRA